jgi:ParB-like chromosome segregation protein Spo0J
MNNIEIHPAAEVFPMLPEGELQELAADIKENGLRESLKTSNGFLIDGRNRLAACEIAGVEPRMEELNGSTDPVAYILSVNINRRHMTRVQRAVAIAMVVPKNPGKKTSLGMTEVGMRNLVSRARQVIDVLPELAKELLSGVEPSLNQAYEKAITVREAAKSADHALRVLREQATDLAELVDEERMLLNEALAAWKQRKSDEAERIKNQRETMMRLAEQAYSSTVAWSVETFWKSVNESLADQEFRSAFLSRVRIDPSNLGEIQKGAKVFARLLTKLTK